MKSQLQAMDAGLKFNEQCQSYPLLLGVYFLAVSVGR